MQCICCNKDLPYLVKGSQETAQISMDFSEQNTFLSDPINFEPIK